MKKKRKKRTGKYEIIRLRLQLTPIIISVHLPVISFKWMKNNVHLKARAQHFISILRFIFHFVVFFSS